MRTVLILLLAACGPVATTGYPYAPPPAKPDPCPASSHMEDGVFVYDASCPLYCAAMIKEPRLVFCGLDQYGCERERSTIGGLDECYAAKSAACFSMTRRLDRGLIVHCYGSLDLCVEARTRWAGDVDFRVDECGIARWDKQR